MGAEVLAYERLRCACLERGDVDGVAGLLANDLVYVHAPGTVHGKQALLEYLRGAVRFERVERRGIKMRQAPGLAWTTGWMQIAGTRLATGEAFSSTSFVAQVWHLEQGNWRLQLFQSTRVDDSLWLNPPV